MSDSGMSQPSFCPDCGVPISGGSHCVRCAPPAVVDNVAKRAGTRSGATPNETEAPANLRSALWLYFTLLGVIAAFTIAYQVVGEDVTPEWEVNADLAVSGVFAAVVLFAAFRFRRSVVPMFTRLGHPGWIIAAPFMAVGTVTLASLIVGAVNSMFSLPEQSYSAPAIAAGYGVWLPLFTVAVCPAVTEEIAFRGVMNSALRNVLEPREAAIVTALLFAILHLSILSFPHLLVMGLVLGYIRHRSKSLYPCILLHFCHNASVVLLEHYSDGV